METLLQLLKEIEDLLEQINGLTANQATILLRSVESLEEENEMLSILEDMVAYKEALITSVEEKEVAFEALYNKDKGQITNPEDVKVFKHYVASILTKKEAIKEQEQSNVAIMKNRAASKVKPVELPKNAQQVTQAYKKQVIR